MVSWQLFGLPRVNLPSFSQIGDWPETSPLDLLDPVKKPLLSLPDSIQVGIRDILS